MLPTDPQRGADAPSAPSTSPAPSHEITARYTVAKRKRDETIARIRREIAETAPRACVLIVDDAAEWAHMLAEVLRHDLGVDTVVVSDADEALITARDALTGDFAAAVVDLHLGHHAVNGLTVAAALPRGVGVFLVSGVMPDELAEAGRRVSAEAVFAKPIGAPEMAALCEAVRARVERSRRFATVCESAAVH